MSYYYEQDVLYLLRRAQPMRLAKLRSARAQLREAVEAGRECEASLRQYPTLRIEALEFHYVCLFGLGALDAHLIEDLCQQTWRGVVWASFLASLAPSPAYTAALRETLTWVPHNRWLVELALACIEGVAPEPESAELLASIEALRSMLAPIARPAVHLRRQPRGELLARITRERERVAAVYRREGADAAQAALVGTELQGYLLEYPQWLKARAGRD